MLTRELKVKGTKLPPPVAKNFNLKLEPHAWGVIVNASMFIQEMMHKPKESNIRELMVRPIAIVVNCLALCCFVCAKKDSAHISARLLQTNFDELLWRAKVTMDLLAGRIQRAPTKAALDHYAQLGGDRAGDLELLRVKP